MAYGTDSYTLTLEITIFHEYDEGSRLDPPMNVAYIDSAKVISGDLPFRVFDAWHEHDDKEVKLEEWDTIADALQEVTDD